MNLSQQVEPDPTLEKRTRRRFGGTENRVRRIQCNPRKAER